MSGVIFKAIDTWMFKEARPMDGFGGSELSSTFPPPVRTLLGALRSQIGDAQGVDWSRFPQEYPELVAQIGDANSYGALTCKGVFLRYKQKRLYPLPLHIVSRKEGDKELFETILIGDTVQCDLGNVRLPILPKNGDERYSPLDKAAWVDETELARILSGEAPTGVVHEKELFAFESRVGIGRDNATHTVKESQLYQTRHIRPHADLEVLLEIEGLSSLPKTGICRLGAEGRAAAFERFEAKSVSKPKKPAKPIEGIFFTLLTPALLDPKAPLGESVTSACVGKSFREGGFDMNAKASRAAQSYIPAGSTWFVSLGEKEAESFIEKHHESFIGQERQLGRGRIVCGYWIKK